MNLLGAAHVSQRALHAIAVPTSHGRHRMLWRTIPADRPHITREDRLWLCRALGYHSGVGYTMQDAYEACMKRPITPIAAQEERHLMAHVGHYRQRG